MTREEYVSVRKTLVTRTLASTPHLEYSLILWQKHLQAVNNFNEYYILDLILERSLPFSPSGLCQFILSVFCLKVSTNNVTVTIWSQWYRTSILCNLKNSFRGRMKHEVLIHFFQNRNKLSMALLGPQIWAFILFGFPLDTFLEMLSWMYILTSPLNIVYLS